MNSIARKLRNITFLTVGTAAAAALVYQTDMVRQLKERLAGETLRADRADRELAVKNTMVEELNADNLRLQDSIQVLHLEIARHEETIAAQQQRIRQLGSTIGDLDSRVKKLSADIVRLEESGRKNLAAVRKLEKERAQLLAKMQELDQARIRADREKEAALRQQGKDAAALAALQAPKPTRTPVVPALPGGSAPAAASSSRISSMG